MFRSQFFRNLLDAEACRAESVHNLLQVHEPRDPVRLGPSVDGFVSLKVGKGIEKMTKLASEILHRLLFGQVPQLVLTDAICIFACANNAEQHFVVGG